jgi:GxxExxY protein
MYIHEVLTREIIGAAIEVHKEIEPGLLESAYQKCLEHELEIRAISFEAEKPIPVEYKGVKLDVGYRLDLLVDGKVIVELKSVEAIEPIHEAQLLTYLKIMRCRIGLLINFNVPVLTQGGIKRRVL